jgi:hypothetical protein
LSDLVLLNVDFSNVVFNTVGPIVVTASYSGDTNYAPSSSSATVNVTGSVTETLSASTINPQPGAAVILTALIDTSVKSPAPGGSVVFFNDTDLISGGQIPGTVKYSQITVAEGNAELQATLSFVPPTYTTFVHAFYTGDANFTPRNSNQITITVPGNDFGMYFDHTSVSAAAPGQAAFQVIRIYGQSNYSGTINFTSASCSGLPAESSCSFTPASIVGNGSTTVLISTTGPHTNARTQARSRQVPPLWSLTVSGLLGALLISVPFRRGRHNLLPLLLVAFLLTLPSCGGGGSSGGGSGSGGGGSGGTGTTTDPGTPAGTYTVTVTATSGSLTHTASFQLIVP